MTQIIFNVVENYQGYDGGWTNIHCATFDKALAEATIARIKAERAVSKQQDDEVREAHTAFCTINPHPYRLPAFRMAAKHPDKPHGLKKKDYPQSYFDEVAAFQAESARVGALRDAALQVWLFAWRLEYLKVATRMGFDPLPEARWTETLGHRSSELDESVFYIEETTII